MWKQYSQFLFCCQVEKEPAAPGLLTIFASIPGKFNVCGVAGVSCVIGSSGFSINGNSGSNKDVLANCCCMLPSAVSAPSKGLGSPIFAAFSANAC